MKWKILILLVLMMIPVVIASEDAIITYSTQDNVTITTLCYTDAGVLCKNTATCNLWVYYPNWTINYTNTPMNYVANGLFNKTIGTYQTEGDYKAFVNCTQSAVNGYSRQDFRISKITKKTILGELSMGGIIIIPFLISALMVVGAIMANGREHKALKIFLYLGSFVPIWFSMKLALANIGDYGLGQETASALAELAQVLSWIWGVLVFYYCLYFVVKLLKKPTNPEMGEL